MLFLALKIFTFIKAKEIVCESVYVGNWSSVNKTLKTCGLKGTTSINKKDVTISNHDDSVQGMTFSTNKHINFLPVRVYQNFPNLIAYGAENCSIKDVSNDNFKGLTKLRALTLSFNQIKTVPFDTFEDLEGLERLVLCE